MNQRLFVVCFGLLGLLCGAAVAGRAPTSNSGNFCQGCRAIVSFSQNFNSSANRDEYREIFTQYCELYYSPSTDYQQGPCPMFVDGLFYVLDHTDPIRHCDQIGACEYNSQVTQQLNSTATNEIPTQVENVVCEFCEQIVDQVKENLDDPKLVDALRRNIESICDFVKAIDQDKQCKQLASKYLDEMLDFIRHIDPMAYCKSIGLCSRVSLPRKMTQSNRRQLPSFADFRGFGLETSVKVGEKPAAAPAVPAPPNCRLCHILVSEMFKLLRENKTEANIENALEKVCNLIYSNGPKRDQCDSMVKAYTRELIQLLADETDPKMICIMLGECDAAALRSLASTRRQLPTSPPAKKDIKPSTEAPKLSSLMVALDPSLARDSVRTCVECKFFIKYLRNQLEEPKSRDELKRWLESHFCERLPQQELVAMCQKTVEAHADVLFEAVAGELDPQEACRRLSCCSSSSLVPMLIKNETPGEEDISRQLVAEEAERITRITTWANTVCDQCIQIVTSIDDYISKHPIDDNVNVLVDKVCNQLPEGSIRERCTYIIKTFGSTIVDLVQDMQNPRQLCSKIYMC